MKTSRIRLEPRDPHITNLKDESPTVRKNLRIMVRIFYDKTHPYYKATNSQDFPGAQEVRVYITRSGAIISNPKDIRSYHYRVLMRCFTSTQEIEISETPVDLDPRELSDDEIDQAVRNEESQLSNLFDAARLLSEEIDVW